MDNASIHHFEGVYDIITGVGALKVFLPPYTPDLMPLEEVLSSHVHPQNLYTHIHIQFHRLSSQELLSLFLATVIHEHKVKFPS